MDVTTNPPTKEYTMPLKLAELETHERTEGLGSKCVHCGKIFLEGEPLGPFAVGGNFEGFTPEQTTSAEIQGKTVTAQPTTQPKKPWDWRPF